MNAVRVPPSQGTSWTEYGERRLELKKLVHLVGPSLRLVWRASPSETVVLLVLQALSGLALPAQVLAGKWALDEVLEASRGGAEMESALPAVAVAVGTLTAGRLVSTASQHRQRLLPELVGQTAMTMLARKAVALDLVALETPAFHDRLVRAQEQAAFRPANMVRDMGMIVTSGVAVVGLAVVLVTVHPVLVLLLVAAVVPLWSTSISGGRAFYRLMLGSTPNRRVISYLRGLLTIRESAKEARAFGLGPYLLEKQQRLFEQQTSELRRLIGQRLRRELLATLASSVVNAAGLVIVLWLHFADQITIGELAAGVGALLLVVPRLNGLVTATGLLHENALFVEDFWSFLEQTPPQMATSSSDPAPRDLSRVSVTDVSFTYPESGVPALKGVSMEIARGETVALVGENGAGKTTLAKLLCRLYDPSSGTISWDGRDIASCDPDDLRRQIAVIFQDFVQYQLSARENVGFGNLAAIDDHRAICEAARRSGAHDFLEALPQGYETMLGRLFETGHELSIGQWQKVALARAFVRDAPLVIMDEPTASLDARAEYSVFETMRELFRDRAVLLISHRFSSVRMADRIYVLDDGRGVQSGSHDELIAAGGLYAELFGLQAASYYEGR
ncbi:MAG TPA: ABC transporter ATP-binding protein [Thermoleophilaceae bacterium]|nr:ABC transporter ATP-binding protein [Thermoleophilaceae bacterium]